MKIPRFRERSLHPWSRRLGTLWRRRVLSRFARPKRVRKIWIGGRPCKRFTLPDSALAAEIERNLLVFEGRSLFPRLLCRMDAELLLEFVEGETPPAPFSGALVRSLAGFFASLYRESPHCVPTEETPFGAELHRDLRFLRDAGVLSEPAWKDLEASSDALAPAEVWVGYDYLDPIPRNFVLRADGRLVAVDVEELSAGCLLGGGVAKAGLRTAIEPASLHEALAAELPFDLAPSRRFAELHFLAGWTRRAYLKGVEKLVEPGRFDAYRGAETTGTATPPSTR